MSKFVYTSPEKKIMLLVGEKKHCRLVSRAVLARRCWKRSWRILVGNKTTLCNLYEPCWGARACTLTDSFSRG